MRRLILTILMALLACSNALAGFNGYLKADTQVIVIIGPFVDVSDGFTPQTDIGNPDTDLTGVDEAELLKHGSTTVVDISGATWAAIANCDGYYGLTLTTSHTDTEGQITIVIQDDSDCLPVRNTFMVLNDNTFEAFFENASEILTVNTTQISGTSQTANDNGADINSILTGTVTNAQGADVATDVAAMIDGSNRIDVGSWLGQAVTLSTGNKPDVNIDEISDDTTAPGNLELRFDGTGYAGGTTVSQADLTQIGGVAQSATDLKDFADAGYDPANNVTQSDMIYQHGTALTETNSGDLAASYSFFFDVDPTTTKTVDDVGSVASGGGSPLAITSGNLGDYKKDLTVYFLWRTVDQGGAAVDPSTAGTIKVYKADGTSEVTAPTGITDTRGFDGLTGIHLCIIDLSANSFYDLKQDYSVVLTGATIDSQSVTCVIATFGIENRFSEPFNIYGSLDNYPFYAFLMEQEYVR